MPPTLSYFRSSSYNGQWVFFDDSHVRPVGDWKAVRSHVTEGRQMPLVLFYSS